MSSGSTWSSSSWSRAMASARGRVILPWHLGQGRLLNAVASPSDRGSLDVLPFLPPPCSATSEGWGQCQDCHLKWPVIF